VPGDRFEDSEQKGRIAARQQAWRNLYNALTLCQFQNPGVERLLTALNAATGWGLEPDDLMTLGKRIVTLKRLLNLKRGQELVEDRLPALLERALEDGGTEGNVPDLDMLLAGAYEEFGWVVDGRPKQETQKHLGLETL
jgi:aldehyde:ferredoxin oxidoreductase